MITASYSSGQNLINEGAKNNKAKFYCEQNVKSGIEIRIFFFYKRIRLLITQVLLVLPIFSSFIRAHAQAMNEYRKGEMSTEVERRPKFVDGNCGG